MHVMPKSLRFIAAAVLMLGLFSTGSGLADGARGTPDEAKAMAEKAAIFCKTKGSTRRRPSLPSLTVRSGTATSTSIFGTLKVSACSTPGRRRWWVRP